MNIFVSLHKCLLNFNCHFILGCTDHHLILSRLNPPFFGEISKQNYYLYQKEHQNLSKIKAIVVCECTRNWDAVV